MNEDPRAADPTTERALDEIEWWFLERGVPHFSTEYDATTAVWTRAAPFLVFMYVANVVWDIWDLSWRDRILDASLSIGVLLGVWVVGNLWRGQRAFARPQRIGAIELVLWVVGVSVPEMIDGVWDGLWVYSLWGLGTLAFVYVVTAYGVLPLAGYVIERLIRSLADVRVAAARALPMLLLFVSFFFLTAETWQTFARLQGIAYGLALMLFVTIGVTFVWSRLRPDVEGLEHFADWEEVREVAALTPAAGLCLNATGVPDAPDLSRRQRINSLLVAVSGQTILAAMVALVMGVFFLVFGFLVVDEALIAAWVPGADAHVYFGLTLSGRTLVFTEELVRVSGFLATFSGFYFGVFSVTDPTFRQGLTEDSTTSLRESLAVRALYLKALSERDAGGKDSHAARSSSNASAS